MKLIVTLFLLVISHTALSIGVSCENIKTYKHISGSYIDVCPTNTDDLQIFAYARGSRTHSCNLEATAVKTGNQYKINSDGCLANFSISGKVLNINFDHSCKMAACGLNANWVNGDFIQ